MQALQEEIHDLVVPSGKTLELGSHNEEMKKYQREIQFQTPGDLVALGLIGSVEHVTQMIEGIKHAFEMAMRIQRDGRGAIQHPTAKNVRPDFARFQKFIERDGVPLGEALLFWQIVRKMPQKSIFGLGVDSPWPADMLEKLRRAWFLLHSLTIEPGATLIVDTPFLDVSQGGIFIEPYGKLVVGNSINFLHIQTQELQGHSTWYGGEMEGWVPNIVGTGRHGDALAPERPTIQDGVPGKTGRNGLDAMCKEWWDIFGSDYPPTVGSPGSPGGAPEDGWHGYDGESGKTIIININTYLGGITIDCSGGWGEDGCDGGRGGDGGQGGDGGWGNHCQPNANGGSGGNGHDGGSGGLGGKGGKGGNVFIYYHDNPNSEQPHFYVNGGGDGYDGDDGEGGKGGKPGNVGRGLEQPASDDIGPRPQHGKDGQHGWHISFPRGYGAAGQTGFVQMP